MSPLPMSVGRFRIERLIGRGAFANVYLARSAEAWAPVALKVLRDALDPSIEAQARMRFLAEERIANAIDDVRIVRILESSRDGMRPCYLAMQYVEGEPFTHAVARMRALEGGATDGFWHYLARLGYEVAQAMTKAHSRGIVHRDLKPDNVLVVRDAREPLRDGRVASPCIKIVDFGIAKANAELFSGIEAPLLTRHFTVLGTVMGSPPYMAPEQNGAAHAVTGKADVYALGVLLTVAALDLDPEKIELGELGFRAALDFEAPLAESAVPATLRRLLSSMVALEPEARPTMREVALELGRLSQANADLARAVHLWAARSVLPSAKALTKLSRSAPPMALWTDDEREFLLNAPLERLERPSGRTARRLAAGALLTATGALAFIAYNEQSGLQALKARVASLSSAPAPGRAANPTTTSASIPRTAQAPPQEPGPSADTLAKNAQEHQELLARQRVAEQRLVQCSTERNRFEDRQKRAEGQGQLARQELDACRRLVDQNEDAAQVCRRELDARSEELVESTSRIRLCMESLRARRVEPSADAPGDG